MVSRSTAAHTRRVSVIPGTRWLGALVVACATAGCNALLDNDVKTLDVTSAGGGSGAAGQGGSAGEPGASGQAGSAGESGTSGQSGSAGESGASGQAGAPDCVPVDSTCSCGPMDSVFEWGGGCYKTQVGAHGTVTLRKTPLGEGKARVVLSGHLTINDTTYGYIRHELPPGFLPILDKPYRCEVQVNDLYGDTSSIPNYGGSKGLSVRRPEADYSNAVLWFVDKRPGKYTLQCTWETEEEGKGSQWYACPSITCLD